MIPIVEEVTILKHLTDIFFNSIDDFRTSKRDERNNIADLFSRVSITLKNVADALEHNDDHKMAGACGQLSMFARQIPRMNKIEKILYKVSHEYPRETADKIIEFCNIEHSISQGHIASIAPERREKLIRDYSYVSGEFKALSDIIRVM